MARAVPACIWGFRGLESCLSLKDLSALSQTRKEWQDVVLAVCSSRCAQQLVQALAASVPGLTSALAADESSNKLLKQLWRVVSFLQQQRKPWGPALAAIPGLLQDSTQLCTVSDLPDSVIDHFVQHGVHINYQQLITAAYGRVAGVELWVQVQQRHGIQTDVPDIIAKLCDSYTSRKEWRWLEHCQPTNPRDIVDLVQVLLNCSPPPHTRSVFTFQHSIATALLSKLLDAATVLRLVPSAVARGHLAVARAALDLPQVRQLSSTAVLQLMQADVAMGSTPDTTDRISKGDMMAVLVQLPAASQIDRKDLKPLVQTALKTGNGAAVKALCTLSGIKGLSVKSVVNLLGVAIKLELDSAVASLCSLPAASQISGSAWAPLATSAVRNKLGCGSAALCKLPAAGHAATETVAGLLSSTVHSELYAAAEALVCLPATQDISLEQLLELTQELATHTANSRPGARATLMSFAKLKAVQDMSSTKLLELLSILAQRVEDCRTAEWLYELPAARDIPAVVMKQHLQEAVQHNHDTLVSALCRCPAAAHVDVDTLLQLIDTAGLADSWTAERIQEMLCKLAINKQLSGIQVKAVMLPMVKIGHPLWDLLEDKPSALAQLTSDIVADLLHAAVKQEYFANVEVLCKLTAARHISSTVLAEIISAALDGRGESWTLKSLCSLPAARQMPEDVAMALIRKAEESGNWHMARAVMALKPRRSARLGRQRQ